MYVKALKFLPISMHVQYNKIRMVLVNWRDAILLHDIARPHVARMSVLGHMLPGYQCSATCCQDVSARPNVARMSVLGQILPGCQCSVKCCQDVSAQPHIARMTLQKFTDFEYETLSHRPYSSLLSPCHFLLKKKKKIQKRSKNYMQRFL